MRSTVAVCLVWIASAAYIGSAQTTPTAPPSTTSTTKYKSPDDAIMKFGHVLGDVIARTDQQETSVKSQGDTQTQAVQQKLDDIDNGVDPDAAKYMRDAPPVEAACPHGQVMPIEEANACEARIAEINAQFAALKARHDDLESQKNQIAINTANKVAELEQKKSTATSINTKIEACSGNPDTMSKKACLDHLFDNTSDATAAYDLDSSVVKPDYLGSQKSVPTIIKSQNQVHDDQAIRNVMKKKITVPPPAVDSTTTPK